MNKHIRSVYLLNESEPFSIVKPLNSSIDHDHILLSKILNIFNWRTRLCELENSYSKK